MYFYGRGLFPTLVFDDNRGSYYQCNICTSM
jgi:hypothetical protein